MRLPEIPVRKPHIYGSPLAELQAQRRYGQPPNGNQHPHNQRIFSGDPFGDYGKNTNKDAHTNKERP